MTRSARGAKVSTRWNAGGVPGKTLRDGGRGQERACTGAVRGDPDQAARPRRAARGGEPAARGEPAGVRGGDGALPPRDRHPRRRREEGRAAARRRGRPAYDRIRSDLMPALTESAAVWAEA